MKIIDDKNGKIGYSLIRFILVFIIIEFALSSSITYFAQSQSFIQGINEFIPPSPINLTNSTGNFWVNHTWNSGTGNITDSYNITVNGTWINGTTQTYYNNSLGPHGWSNITIYAYNSSGNGSLSSSVSQNTQVPNNPPIQATIGNKTVIGGNTITFTVSATDPDSDVIVYGTNATKGVLNSSTGVYTWSTTTADIGIYTWFFSSTDSYGGVDTETITITVTSGQSYVPPSPVNLTNSTGNFWVNHTWNSGNGSVTDSYNISVNGTWINGTTQTYYNNSVGPHGWSNITIYAYNSSGNGNLSSPVSQNTQVPNNPPVQAIIGDKIVFAGDIITFTVSATDPDLDTIVYGTNATKGTLNPSTGVYTWSTTTADIGTYTWSFSSTDSYGGVDTETITITVTEMKGGPGCLECHNTSRQFNISNITYIDGNAFKNSVHVNMNHNNASIYGINASCWACHSSNGSVPANNTHPDRKLNPYICTDCHLSNGIKSGAYNSTIISNHYKNGTQIKAPLNSSSDIASCIICHENVSIMIISNNDNDIATNFQGDGIGNNGGNTSFYHYGNNVSSFGKTKGSYEYCIYCHRNNTGEFNKTFQNLENANISNHSLTYNSSTPSCSVCHNSTNSDLHNISLIKPNLTIPNSSYCLNCHGNNGNNATNYSNSITGFKEKHNNTINCTECHIGTNKRNIHPMTYLQKDTNYTTNITTAVNCVDCHQTNKFDSIIGIIPPKIPTPMNHSNNTLNGSVWNKTSPYWTNTSQQTMCDYCHGNTIHNKSSIGRISNWQGNNIIDSQITNNTNWCASCHYQKYSSGNKTYDDMVNTFKSLNLSIPPEITGNSTYAPTSISGYVNHSLTNYKDFSCKNCHNYKISSSSKISGFIHNVTKYTCKECHYNYNLIAYSGEVDDYVNQTMYNNSAHASLNCEDCHTKGHNNIAARKSCEDCHVVQNNPITDTDRHKVIENPRNYNINNVNVIDIKTCNTCHSQQLLDNATATYGPPPKAENCDYCHTYPDKNP